MFLLDNARSFLAGAEHRLASGVGGPGDVAHSVSIAIELALKAHLAERGWSDDRRRTEIRHDLVAALQAVEAEGLALPDRLPTALIARASEAYRRHELDRAEMSAEEARQLVDVARVLVRAVGAAEPAQ